MNTLRTWFQARHASIVTAMAVLTVFGTLAASFAEAQTYALSVSTNSNHSGGKALQGATLSGSAYVFTSYATNLQNYHPTGITSVCFWLDNPSRSGTATHCEYSVPYDYISSASTTVANPWNTKLVSNGTHSITQAVTKSAGGTEVDTATFTVQNQTVTVSLSATSLVFGSQTVGTTSAAQTVTLTNSGTAQVNVSGVTVTGDYAISGNNCTTLTTSGTNCGIGVAFKPTTTGTRTGKLTITDNATNSPQSVSLTGTGAASTQPTITFTANPTTIPQGGSSVLTWTTANATSVSIDNGVGAVTTSGSVNVSPVATASYTVTATGPGGVANKVVTVTVGTAAIQHLVYVVCDQTLYVYDLDNGFQLLKQVSIPQAQGVRGVGAVPGTNTLYISYGYDGTGGISIPGSLLAYNLLTDTVVWTQSYTFGIDSFAITPNGNTIYMPVGSSSGSGVWHVLNAANGALIATINTGGSGAHDTVASLDGNYVFMGPHTSTWWAKTSTSSNTVVLKSGQLNGGIGPFTINGKYSLLFSTETGYFGFQVSNASNGTVLYSVPVSGFSIPPGFNPSHGISLSPDETEIYLIDTANSYAHVFDVSGLPSATPTQVADIPLTTSFAGTKSPCLYDCEREGWMLHTLDGQYVIVGDSGAVISTNSRSVAGTLPQLYNTRVYLEIDWQNGLPIATSTREGVGRVTK